MLICALCTCEWRHVRSQCSGYDGWWVIAAMLRHPIIGIGSWQHADGAASSGLNQWGRGHLQSQLPELVSLGPGVLNGHHAAEGDVHPLEHLPPPASQVLPDVLLQGPERETSDSESGGQHAPAWD